MAFSFGDVVLVPFPFTDQSAVKKRPAVVVSSKAYNISRQDLIILAITSQIGRPLAFAEADVADWKTAGLIKPSIFKSVVTTIEQGKIIRVLGRLSARDDQTLHAMIARMLG